MYECTVKPRHVPLCCGDANHNPTQYRLIWKVTEEIADNTYTHATLSHFAQTGYAH